MGKIEVEGSFLAYDLRGMQDRPTASFGSGWVFLSLALAAHVTDEALTGFLDVYNPTVLAMRARYSWFPMPVFGFREWLIGLICGVIILVLLTPFAMRGSRWMRPLAYFLSIMMILNGLGHTLGTAFGRTVSTIHFARPMPGFWSSPLLLGASGYLLYQLRRRKVGVAKGAAAI
ncbi:MAG TPA: hypothetical protein VF493_09765 [Terriglobales bacterium]